MTQPPLSTSSSQSTSRPDYRGRLVTYMDEEVEDNWVIHPKYALRAMTDKEKDFFEEFDPKIAHQDAFFRVLDEARRKQGDLTDDDLRTLIESVPPQELSMQTREKKDRGKRYRFVSRRHFHHDTGLHLIRKLRSQKYLGTPGKRCNLCGRRILHNDDLKRHKEKVHKILRKRKALEQVRSVPTSTESHSVPSTAQELAAMPPLVIINQSPNANIIIVNNPQPSYGTNAAIQQTPADEMAGSYPRLSLAHVPGPSDSWSHYSGSTGPSALSATPTMFRPEDFLSQFLETDVEPMQQQYGVPSRDSSHFASVNVQVAQADVPVISNVYTPMAHSIPVQHPMYASRSTTTRLVPAPQTPPYFTDWYIGSTPASAPAAIGSSPGYAGGVNHQAFAAYADPRYVQRSGSTDVQWEKLSWCYSSDLVFRSANAFHLAIVSRMASGLLALLLIIIMEEREKYSQY
ncbi:hypothetical protein FRC17_008918 [Serendipita sp. 399]|nr:hypothetical protein FRC17_008918 [Serendipita sp. 399]